ncbi:MAG: hypothetical protein EOP49_10430 [Sphingobacteriales bacterium]|nr:MAG: hypothetical protein EOP49_10430 [Sphingobacteriales bacterium]
MEKHDWSKFVLKINIDADVEDIYDCWSVPLLMEKWFLRKAVFVQDDQVLIPEASVREGDTYEWYWHGHSDEAVEKGEILETNHVNQIKFSFVSGAEVTVDIGVVGGESVVMVTQELIPTDEHGMVKYNMGCQVGWTFYLTNLKSYLEGGIDLRNKNLLFTGVVNS